MPYSHTYTDGEMLTAERINTDLRTPVPTIGDPVWIDGPMVAATAPQLAAAQATGVTLTVLAWKRMGPFVFFTARWNATIDVTTGGNIINTHVFTLLPGMPTPIDRGASVLVSTHTGPVVSYDLQTNNQVHMTATVPNATQTATVATALDCSVNGYYLAV
jgi:hypothetical protein